VSDLLEHGSKSSNAIKDGALHSLTQRISILGKYSALSWLFNDALSIEVI
jgi:hypothetical protein